MSLTETDIDDLRARLDALEKNSEPGRMVETHYFNLIGDLLHHDGYVVKAMRMHPEPGIDMVAESGDRLSPVRLGLEFKHLRDQRKVMSAVLEQALKAVSSEQLDRIALVSNRSFSSRLKAIAARTAPVQVFLWDPVAIRDWIRRAELSLDNPTELVTDLTREFLRRVALGLAQDPKEIWKIEWRFAELLLGEIFSKLGFEVEVTPSTNDGGKDVVLCATLKGELKIYYIELKHWRTTNVGAPVVRDFLKVVARDKVDGGLFIGSSGFTAPVFEVLADSQRPIALGDQHKILGLCRTYARSSSPLWTPPSNPFDLLSDDAVELDESQLIHP